MERFLQVCFVHHSLPVNCRSWTHDFVWGCLFDPQLEDPSAGALQPSSPGPGNLLLVIHFRVDIPGIVKHIKKLLILVLCVLCDQDSPRISSLALDSGKEADGHSRNPEGSSGEQKDHLTRTVREGKQHENQFFYQGK